MNKILVTGATGFIGQYLVRFLKEKNYNVRVFVRDEKKARKIFDNKIECIIGDLSDNKKIEESINNVDMVYHLAAIRGENKSLNKEDYFKNNILPTKLLCEHCLRRNIKLVYLSSSGVNGWQKKLPINEDSQYLGKGLYHWSKIESEKEILSRHGLKVVIVRSVMVYGDGDDGFLYKLINSIEQKRFFIIGNGENRIHLLDVNNLVLGLYNISVNFIPGIYYMADDYPITINRLVKILSNKFNVEEPIKIPLFLMKIIASSFDFISVLFKINMPVSIATVDILTKDRYYSIEKAKKDLGFKGGNVENYIWQR